MPQGRTAVVERVGAQTILQPVGEPVAVAVQFRVGAGRQPVEVGEDPLPHGIGVGRGGQRGGVDAVPQAVAVAVRVERVCAEGHFRAVVHPVEVGVGAARVGAVDEKLVVGGEAVAVVVADIGVEQAEGAPAQLKAIGECGGIVEGVSLAAAVVQGADEEVGEGVAGGSERGAGGYFVPEAEIAVSEELGLEGDRAVGVAPGVEVLPGQQQAAGGRGRVPEAPLRRHGAEAAVQRREQAGVLGHGGGGRSG